MRIFFLWAAFPVLAYGQMQQDRLDSLEKRLREIEIAYQKTQRMVDILAHSQWDSNDVETLMTETARSGDIAMDDQRNRKSRLNNLLKELRSKNGVLNFYGDATAVMHSLRSSSWAHEAEGSFDLFAQTQLDSRNLIFVNLEAIGGNGSNAAVTTLTSLNGDAGSTQDGTGFDRLHVLEAWWEGSTAGQRWIWTVGKIDLTNYFDNNAYANDETAQFIAAAFVNSAAFAAPSNSPGLRFRFLPASSLAFQFALVSSDNSGEDIFRGLFVATSMVVRVSPWDKNGAYRVYAYRDGSDERLLGMGVSLNQQVAGSVGLFGRWARNSKQLASRFGIRQSWSVGVALQKPLAVGVAAGQTEAADPLLRKEIQAEAYVAIELNSWMRVSPHVQRVWNAGGTKSKVFAAGVRSQFHF